MRIEALCAVPVRLVGAGLALLLLAGQAAPQPGPSIEKLVADGWEVAGYVAAWENRSLILFKHKNQSYLVQCSVLIDVMRNPRQVVYCYELH
ncbi:MAG TPA: hypothetical protein VN523_14210 [Hyphomicrobiaceae bacterium]|jgi:hypothetical protein|nr:hypothetical protein [Hyphomicrobiaceae bacterium]